MFVKNARLNTLQKSNEIFLNSTEVRKNFSHFKTFKWRKIEILHDMLII